MNSTFQSHPYNSFFVFLKHLTETLGIIRKKFPVFISTSEKTVRKSQGTTGWSALPHFLIEQVIMETTFRYWGRLCPQQICI